MQNERVSLIRKAIGWGFVAKIIGSLSNLLQVPIALSYLKPEAFGLWMALAGAVQLMSFTDLGIGLGLQNRISEAAGKSDYQRVLDLQKTGFRVLSLIGLIVALIAIPMCWLIPWGVKFKVMDVNLMTQVPITMVSLVTMFAVSLPLNVGVKLASGLQYGWIIGAWTSAGSVFSVLIILLGIWLKSSFFIFVTITTIGTFASSIAINIHANRLIAKRTPFYKASFDASVVRGIIKDGTMFFIPQITYTFINAAPSMIIAAALGPSSIVAFSVCKRITSVILQFQQIPLYPLWPLYAESKARNDHVTVIATFKKSIYYALISSSGVSIGFALIGNKIMSIWLGTEFGHTLQIYGFAAWMFIVGMFTPATMLLNGWGKLGGQAIGFTISGLLIWSTLKTFVIWFGVDWAALYITGIWFLTVYPFGIYQCLSILSGIKPNVKDSA